MNGRINKKRLAGAVVILLLLFLLGGGVATMVKDAPAEATVPPEANEECASQVHFFAQDAPVGSNFFGPASEGNTLEEHQAELRRRRCLDPVLTVVHAHEWGLEGFSQLSGDDQYAAKTRELIGNPEAWGLVVYTIALLEDNSVASLETMSGSYQTLYMLWGVADVPLVRQAEPDRPSFEVIRFVHPDGRIVNLKLDCGFQPVRQESFPGIPHLEKEGGRVTTTTVPGRVTTTTVPGRVTTTTVPPGRKGVVPTTVPPPPVTVPRQTTTTIPTPPVTAKPDPTPPEVVVVNTTIPPRTHTPDGKTNTGPPPTTVAPAATNPGADDGNGGQTTPSR